MSDTRLALLAQHAGLSIHWTDAHGRPQQVTPEAQRRLVESLGHAAQSRQQIDASLAELQERARTARPPPLVTLDQGTSPSLAMHFEAYAPFVLQSENGQRLEGRLDSSAALPAIDQCGYHQLLIGEHCLTLAVAPFAAPGVDDCIRAAGHSNRRRIWGLTAQLYALRRAGDGGLGDMQALEMLLQQAARHGADAVAISPIHAMFAANPGQYSPYSPSSRLFFNVLHASPTSVVGEVALRRAILDCGVGDELARLETPPLIDWQASARARLRLLRQLHRQFDAHPDRALAADFADFRKRGGEALERHCRFEALHGHLLAQGQSSDWRHWPAHYRDPEHAVVAEFARENSASIEFHAFAQWLIARSLQHAQKSARDAGMSVGIIADLAVGADGAGSQAWSSQTDLLPTISVGAPPDVYNRNGQSWGVSAFCPQALLATGFRSWIDMLRANLAHVGGIRIDHAMGLQRLWVIPQGMPPEAGAYLNYPFTDLLRLLTLEASRRNALVIGEDLGTVPDGLRDQLAQRNILGMRVLLFEQHHGHFIAPQHWSHDALAVTTTHDLPTLRGWFSGRDIDWRHHIGERDMHQRAHDHSERAVEAGALHRALQDNGLLGHDTSPEALVDACVGFIGRTPAPLTLLPLEDALALEDQPNLPGPGDIHPNWRRRMPDTSDQLLEPMAVQHRLQMLDQACRAESHKREQLDHA
jgi:4-alpha-glucanotransferase